MHHVPENIPMTCIMRYLIMYTVKSGRGVARSPLPPGGHGICQARNIGSLRNYWIITLFKSLL